MLAGGNAMTYGETINSGPLHCISRLLPVESDACTIPFELKPNEFMLIELGGDPAAKGVIAMDADQSLLNDQLQTESD
jgi:hypothetical protein